MIKKHKAFQLCDSGLVVRSDYPYLGASPDGVVSCACCGNGVVEVKCPYSCCDNVIYLALGQLSSPCWCAYMFLLYCIGACSLGLCVLHQELACACLAVWLTHESC